MFRRDEVVGEYRLERPLGDGALGVVWAAQRIDRDEQVALKLMNPGRVPERARNQAFEGLTHALTRTGRLEHPNLQALFGLAHRAEDAVFGVAAKLYEGGPFENLGNVAHRESLVKALKLLRQVAQTLAWLHERDLVHGNLKPSNVLITPSRAGPRAVLLDLCWSTAGLGRRTEATRIFVSPEQLAKQAPTAASDQWATARMMHQLAVRSAPGRSATEALTQLPLPVLRVLKRALEHDPQSRFASMESFLHALEHAEEELGSAGASAPAALPTPTLEVSVQDAVAVQEDPTAPHRPPLRAKPKESLHEVETMTADPFEEHTFEPERAPVEPHADVTPTPGALTPPGMPPMRDAPTEPGLPKPTFAPPALEEAPLDPSEEQNDPTTPLSVQAINPSTEREAPPPARREPVRPSDPTDVLPVVAPPKKSSPARAIAMIAVALLVIGGSAVVLWKNQEAADLASTPANARAATPTPAAPAKAGPETPAPKKAAPEPPAPKPAVATKAPAAPSKTAPPPARPAPGAGAVAAAKPTPANDPLSALREGCEANRRQDCRKLGEAYLAGDGVERNQAKARQYLGQACDLRLISTCEPVGKLYARTGRSSDARRARRYLERACDAGRGSACATLAGLWRDGRGGRTSERTADAFAHRACQLGYKSSCVAGQ